MKELEDDAIRAQAVIVKAQEMQNEAADTDSRTTNSQNGEAEVGIVFIMFQKSNILSPNAR